MEHSDLTKILGPFPENCALEPRIVDSVDCGTYTRETIEYAVEVGERVKAFLLVPKNSNKKLPAILAHHQHNSQFHIGKSEVVGLAGDPDQAYAAELTERGYIVIAPDALAFEERNWSNPAGHAEYYELASRLVQGKTFLAKCLHDITVAVDYLVTRPEVDASRIGFIGHSYGGKMAIWSPAMDKRIVASVSNCGCVNYKTALGRDIGIQMEFCLPGILEWGDMEDVVNLIAPRALLIQATTEDKWSRGAKEIYEFAKPSFPDGQLELRCWDGGHVFTQEMRLAAYEFLDRHLKANDGGQSA